MIIDVSALPEIDPGDFNATLVLHTWEYGRAPEEVETFVGKNRDHLGKVIMFATSGEGNNSIEGIDGLAGASTIKDIFLYTDWILLKLDALLPHEKSQAYFLEPQHR
jgi:hypothetical protein